MFSHIVVGSNDLEASKKFYDATFAVLGISGAGDAAAGRIFYMSPTGNFMVTKPINGEPATHANGGTIGLTMTPEQADAWHQAGVENGGTTCEDPPGVRDMPFGKMYLAYLRDPDGNKLCAFHMMAG
ncbi:VOC family protein [Novosphingobium sp. TH158]|uniref:VOC family protein n=1 Tax=Novosphingobium sp. TH158 TaxID=2067455 RepID=UPI000C7DAEC8|nr:VOC family protein [Novosphingobium sp. TH158]PLK27060.1 glyoxalase [Novosphingobium sp. TH158]